MFLAAFLKLLETKIQVWKKSVLIPSLHLQCDNHGRKKKVSLTLKGYSNCSFLKPSLRSLQGYSKQNQHSLPAA